MNSDSAIDVALTDIRNSHEHAAEADILSTTVDPVCLVTAKEVDRQTTADPLVLARVLHGPTPG